jgi:putative phosphoesterase
MALIGLISDVHATPAPVAEALSIFVKAGVEQIFCAGDIAGYGEAVEETVALLVESGCRTVLGNHDLLYLERYDDAGNNNALEYFEKLPPCVAATIEGKRVYMVHAQPPDACHGGIKLRDRDGEVKPDRLAHWTDQLRSFEHDVLVVGHTHQVFAEYIGHTLVVNPGSSVFNHSCAILRLPDMTVETFPLSGKAIARTWNWSDYRVANSSRGSDGQ